MEKKLFTRVISISMLCVAFASLPAVARPQDGASMPEIWIKSGAHLVNIPPPWQGMPEDAGAMWKPDAPWPTVAARVKVAEFASGNIQWAKDEDLQYAFAEMERRHIGLALGTGLLTRTDRCQAKNEAVGAPGELEQMLEKIRRTGGDLRYIAMDEPYYWGHKDDSGCHQSVAELATNVAANVVIARRVFPKVQIGDIEVVSASRPWIDELTAWADAYRAAVGEKLAFFQTDINWSELAMRNLKPLSDALKSRDIRLAIIYNADASAHSDESWEQSAESHIDFIESVLGIHPQLAVFDSWTRNPSHRLPESQPGTLTNLVLHYLRSATSLTLAREGDTITGRLTDLDGSPIADAEINLSAVDVGGRMGPLPRHIEGTVPKGAATAVIGIRVDMEGACVCAGDTGAIVGGIHYKEKGTGKPQQDISPVSLPIQRAPVSVRTLALVPGKTFAPNLKQFPVTAGAPYTLDTAIAATAAAEHAGYVTIVFIDAAGKGLGREFLWFTPSAQQLGKIQTDAHGAIRFPLPATVTFAEPEVRAEYSGSASQRSALGLLASPLGVVSSSLPALEPVLFGKTSPLTMLAMRSDFGGMFVPESLTSGQKAQWDQVAGRIQVAYFSGGGILKMPDEALARLVRDLKARHVGLGPEILATNWFHERPCGGGIEGFIDPGSANQVVAKLLKAGASLEQVGMDEPLWFGHFYSGKNACQSSIPELASRVAVIAKIYTAAFPNVVVGDIEPFPAVSKQPNWQSAFANWVKTFHSTVGTPLSFLRLDFNWGDESLSADGKHNVPDAVHIAHLARQVIPVAKQNGLLVDMILNGGGAPIARSDLDWTQQARLHIRALQAPGIHFDQVLFESWDKFPAHTLPESDPNTLSSLIPSYREH
jgi:hypothetical protein